MYIIIENQKFFRYSNAFPVNTPIRELSETYLTAVSTYSKSAPMRIFKGIPMLTLLPP